MLLTTVVAAKQIHCQPQVEGAKADKDKKDNKEKLFDTIDGIRREKNALHAPFKEGKEEFGSATILLGRTGVGKTTLLQLLSGGELTGEKQRFGNRYSISTVEKAASSEVNKRKALIGHRHQSETSLPNYRRYKGESYWDCAGFGDTRGSVQKLLNISYLKMVFDPKQANKIVLVVEENDLWDVRATNLRNFTTLLDNLFPDLASMATKFSLVVTKATCIEKEGINAYFNELASVGNLSVGVKSLYQYFASSEARITFFWMPKKAGPLHNSGGKEIEGMLAAAPSVRDIKIKSKGIDNDAKEDLNKALAYARLVIKRLNNKLNSDIEYLVDKLISENTETKQLKEQLTALGDRVKQLLGISTKGFLGNYQSLCRAYPSLPDSSNEYNLWLGRISFIEEEYLAYHQ